MEVARQVPSARVIVQDINVEGLSMGRDIVAKDPQLKGHVEFMEHSIFNPQPIAADVYLFRHVLHDWPDADCVKILKALVPALKEGARVLLSEGVMKETSHGRTALLEDMHVR